MDRPDILEISDGYLPNGSSGYSGTRSFTGRISVSIGPVDASSAYILCMDIASSVRCLPSGMEVQSVWVEGGQQ